MSIAGADLGDENLCVVPGAFRDEIHEVLWCWFWKRGINHHALVGAPDGFPDRSHCTTALNWPSFCVWSWWLWISLQGFKGFNSNFNLHHKPPINGRKKATSSPSLTVTSDFTYSILIAAKHYPAKFLFTWHLVPRLEYNNILINQFRGCLHCARESNANWQNIWQY